MAPRDRESKIVWSEGDLELVEKGTPAQNAPDDNDLSDDELEKLEQELNDE